MKRRPDHKHVDRKRRPDHRLSRKHVRQLLATMRKAGISAANFAEAIKTAAAAFCLKKGGHF